MACKLWLDKFQPDSSDSESPLCDISWTSSESEETPRKIMKLSRTDSNNWIKPLISQNHSIPTKEHPLHNIEESPIICTLAVQESPIISTLAVEESPIISTLAEKKSPIICTLAEEGSPTISTLAVEESPIIGTLTVEEMSPVHVETSSAKTILDMSPVIGNRHRLKTVRSRYLKMCKARQKVLVTPESSPDLFESKATQVIENVSPEPIGQDSIFYISQSSDYQASSSQSNSQIMLDSLVSDSPKTNDGSLYHQPALRRKKRYKKGGLASQLQKSLQLQRSRISIWQHELYTKKIDTLELNGKIEIVEFVIETIHREYGSTLLECKVPKLEDFENLENHPNCAENNMEPFLVLVGNLLNITLLEGNKYSMFPPFCIKTVSHKSREVKCYFGVNKITNSKQ